MKPDKYYLGLDMGSTSVGFAATDPDYNLLKANRKQVWGVRLFDEASTAAKRRFARSSRRRREREVLRLKLLQDLFSEPINAIDPAFFQRLKDSFFYPSDKTINQRFSLFNDPNFTDLDYHQQFPTIYHLRQSLMSESKPFDIRLIYLALHHILKHRGHFLYAGQAGFELGSALEQRYLALQSSFSEVADVYMPDNAQKIIHDTLINPKLKRADKVTKIMTGLGWDEKFQLDLIKLLLGYSIKLTNLFGEEFKEVKPDAVCFDKAGFEDEKQEQYAAILSDSQFSLLVNAYQFYGHMRLETLLQGHTSLSAAKITLYNKHQADLKLLKSLLTKEQRKQFFNTSKANYDNYAAYVGYLRSGKTKQPVNYRCQAPAFYDEVKRLLNALPEPLKSDQRVNDIMLDIENGMFMPRQKSKDNSLIPNQLQMLEAKAILDNAEKHHDFLRQPGAEGLTIRQMIESLISFRIPYYVGPLNQTHRFNRAKPTGSAFAWATKTTDEPVRPWNFHRVIDESQSAIDFIANLTNKCSFLIGEDVLPKASPTYSQYAILNLINSIAVNAQRLDVTTKQQIFRDYFLNPNRRERLTRKSLLNWLRQHGFQDVSDSQLSGMDLEIPGDMNAELTIERIAPKALNRQQKDEIVRLLTTLPDSGDMIRQRLGALFGGFLTDAQITALAKLKFSGWRRLSAKLLDGLISNGPDGQPRTILAMMWDYNYNLQEVLAANFDFSDQIAALNQETLGSTSTISYRTVQEYPTSPAVKKMIWQALKIVKEITTVMKQPPERIFLEVAREEGTKERTTSRKRQLEALYKQAGEINAQLSAELNEMTDQNLRRKKIFLYFLQMGKCAYSGEPIDLENIDGKDSSGKESYDIDHIYPRSLTKDDSLHNNLVLVKGILNRQKGDDFPLQPGIQKSQFAWWSYLKSQGLMSAEKFNRLTRVSHLSEDDLAGFINRQLVETRQATKAAAQILQQTLPETRIVFVKAGHVSDFRYNQTAFKFPKVRGMNDLHHAKDAYLNIVVGNVFDTKFTTNPRNFIRSNPPRSYNLARMYDFEVSTASGNAVWVPGEKGTIATVSKTLARNNILVTYQTRHPHSGQNGGLFDQMILPKGQGQHPIKTSDPRLNSSQGIERYGAYNKPTGYGFFVVDHLQGKKPVRTILPLPLSFVLTSELTDESLIRYCAETLKLVDPKIVLRDLPYNSIFKVNGFPLRLLAKTGANLKVASALQPVFPTEFEPLLKQLLRVEGEQAAEEQATFSQIDEAELLRLFEALTLKISSAPYDRQSAYVNQAKNLRSSKICFEQLSLFEKQKALRQIVNLFLCDGRSSDLSLLQPKNEKGEASSKNKQAGILTLSQNIQMNMEVNVLFQSVTGLFEQEFPLSPPWHSARLL